MPEGHLNIFSNRTMNNYLQKVGFNKIAVTNQGDKLMDILKNKKILSPGESKPRNIFKRGVFMIVRSINHFISSGMRIYAVK